MINNSKIIPATIVALLLLVHFALSANAQSGVVFDDVTGDVITGTEVTLQYEPVTGSGTWVTPLATDTPPYSGGTGVTVITPTAPGGTTGTNPQTIGDFGFSWGAAEGLTFRLAVSATGYTFPSDQTSWQIDWTGMAYTDTGVVSGTTPAFRGGSFIQPAVPVQIDIPVSVITGATTSGSSGNNKNKGFFSCGYLGIEPLLLIGLIILTRRKKLG